MDCMGELHMDSEPIYGQISINVNIFSIIQALINMSYCTLLLIGKGVQVVAFGNLRVSEVQVVKVPAT